MATSAEGREGPAPRPASVTSVPSQPNRPWGMARCAGGEPERRNTQRRPNAAMPTDTGSVHRHSGGVKNADSNGWGRLRGRTRPRAGSPGSVKGTRRAECSHQGERTFHVVLPHRPAVRRSRWPSAFCRLQSRWRSRPGPRASEPRRISCFGDAGRTGRAQDPVVGESGTAYWARNRKSSPPMCPTQVSSDAVVRNAQRVPPATAGAHRRPRPRRYGTSRSGVRRPPPAARHDVDAHLPRKPARLPYGVPQRGRPAQAGRGRGEDLHTHGSNVSTRAAARAPNRLACRRVRDPGGARVISNAVPSVSDQERSPTT